MACKIVAGRNAIFVLWGRPSIADVEAVQKQVRTMVEAGGTRVTYVTRVPAESAAPSGEVLRYIHQILPDLLADCSTYHVVLEGTGFVAAVKRSVLASMLMVSRQKKIFVHSTLDELYPLISESARREVATLLRAAHVQGLSDGGPPLSVPPTSRPDPGAHAAR